MTRDAEDERVFLIWEEFTDEAAMKGKSPIPHLMSQYWKWPLSSSASGQWAGKG